MMFTILSFGSSKNYCFGKENQDISCQRKEIAHLHTNPSKFLSFILSHLSCELISPAGGGAKTSTSHSYASRQKKNIASLEKLFLPAY